MYKSTRHAANVQTVWHVVFARKLLQHHWRITGDNTNWIIIVLSHWCYEKTREVLLAVHLCSSAGANSWAWDMSLKHDSSRKKHDLENWRDYGGSLDRFDRNNWRRRGLYEDLSNATKCGTSQVSEVAWILYALKALLKDDPFFSLLYSTREKQWSLLFFLHLIFREVHFRWQPRNGQDLKFKGFG